MCCALPRALLCLWRLRHRPLSYRHSVKKQSSVLMLNGNVNEKKGKKKKNHRLEELKNGPFQVIVKAGCVLLPCFPECLLSCIAEMYIS